MTPDHLWDKWNETKIAGRPKVGLYVQTEFVELDAKHKVLGRVEGFATTMGVSAVRFEGDYPARITYHIRWRRLKPDQREASLPRARTREKEPVV